MTVHITRVFLIQLISNILLVIYKFIKFFIYRLRTHYLILFGEILCPLCFQKLDGLLVKLLPILKSSPAWQSCWIRRPTTTENGPAALGWISSYPAHGWSVPGPGSPVCMSSPLRAQPILRCFFSTAYHFLAAYHFQRPIKFQRPANLQRLLASPSGLPITYSVFLAELLQGEIQRLTLLRKLLLRGTELKMIKLNFIYNSTQTWEKNPLSK